MLMWIESGLVSVCLLLAFPFSKYNPSWIVTAENTFRRIAERQKLSILLVGLLALLARVAVLPLLPVPEPSINDEFSHLLAADTFAHGRVTNPPHPLWIHFETFHVIQKPTYASMYPPAQGLIMALGQTMTGSPFVGVCLSVALFCASLCWMLQGWTSPSYALLGGLIAIMRFGMFSYWANSYWGGAMAAVGGALVLGALPRIMKTQSTPAALVMGVGFAILANSRPYEGLILGVAVAAVLLAWLLRKQATGRRVAIYRVAPPLVVVVVLASLATGYYFWRVTGSPFLMPQMVDRETYAVAPYFLWQSPRPEPVYHHETMRYFYLHNELSFYRQNRSPFSFIALTVMKFFSIWLFYLGPLLTLPLAVACAAAPCRPMWANLSEEMRLLLVIFGFWFAGLAVEVFFYPHYAAPIACLLFALALRAMSYARTLKWRGRPVGLSLTRLIPLCCLLLVAVRISASPLHLPVTPDWPLMWYNAVPLKTDRARVLAELEQYPGGQLALVRYADHRKSRYDWVYNRADIDGAKVVWAWDMGETANGELIEYFKDRRVWLVQPDGLGKQLSPYVRKHKGD
jgi:hypothetical protein